MVNRLVSVNEDNQLPPEVQAQLVGSVEDHFQDLTDEAQSAATSAATSSSSAIDAASTALGASAQAQEAAQEATAPTNEMVSSFLQSNLNTVSGFNAGIVSGDVTTVLQSTLSSMSTGQVLELPAGTFTLSAMVDVPQGVGVFGVPGRTVINFSGARSAFQLAAGADRNTFYGLTFVGTIPVNGIGTTLEQVAINTLASSAAAPVTRLHIERCTFNNIEGCAVRIKHLREFSVVNNQFSRYGYAGLAVYSGLNGLVQGNSFTGTNVLPSYAPNSYAAFASTYEPDGEVGTADSPRSADIRFVNNFVQNQAWEGFDTHVGERISFIGNQFLNCSGNAIAAVGVGSQSPLGCRDIVIASNVITGPSVQGVARMGIVLRGQATGIAGAERATGTITGNVIKWVGEDVSTVSGGIVVANGLGVTVSGNSISEVRSNGVVIQDSPGTTVTGNVIKDVWRTSGTATAVYVSRVADITTDVTLTGNRMVRGRLVIGTDIPTGSSVNTAGYAGTNSNTVTVYQESNFFPDGTLFSGSMNHVGSGPRGTQRWWGTGPPSAGVRTWTLGDQIINAAPTAGGYIGWICITAGNPGTWRAYGLIA